MKNYKIIETINRENFYDWANSYEDIFVKRSQLKFHQYRDNISITKVSNAMERGAVCTGYSIRLVDRFGNTSITNAIQADLDALVSLFDSLDFQKNFRGYLEDQQIEIAGIKFSVSKHLSEGIRIYSPFNVPKLKPLPEKPKKWTLSHLYRALANGQINGIKCTGHYTDDYAYDAAVNCEIGLSASSEALLIDILESPSGWRVYETNDNNIEIHCHSFLGYQGKFN